LTRATAARLLDRPALVCGLYVAVTIGMTWPLARGLTRDLPSDLGDPAFVAAMLTWGSHHWLDLLSGDGSAVWRFWNAPFFYPEPLVTAFSEHFALHSLLTLPLFAVTRNVILCYNVLFLGTFALSGFGMYLFVRECTGRSLAAFVAGLAFAFAPYRIASLSHLQVLSSQWMPFALYGFRRYFSRVSAGRPGAVTSLAGATGALWAQHLSSGYYMVFFGPFVAIYVLAEIAFARLYRSLKVWLQVGLAGGGAVLLTLPFAMPYLTVRKKYNTSLELHALTGYSAVLLAWLTASPLLDVWGHLQTFVRLEGVLFPGATIVVLTICGLWYGWSAVVRSEGSDQGTQVAIVFGTIAIALSFWLSLGPQIQLRSQPTGLLAIYQIPYKYVPGYDVARVPARFAMITALAMALVSGIALAALEQRRRWIVYVCGVLLLIEGAAFPFPRNGTWTTSPTVVSPPEARVYPESALPPLYAYLRSLDNAVIAHLPFGLPEREIQYVYYSAIHHRRIVNGYSGAFPPTYLIRLGDMQNVVRNPRAATVRMVNDGVTHLVIHSGAWSGTTGRELVALFDRANGFERVATFGTDVVYRLHY